LGRTEENPFELGRRGLPHQHFQFGTGTWDPILGLGAGRRLGSVNLALTGLFRFVVAESSRGYRAGNRTLRVPIVTRVNGAQLDYPLLVSIGWSSGR